ncbi:cytosolic sulfotransferase 5-like isoform X2 [Andrographis paniculata]|uniref:cytosolic sulfotransferase 5-like isoform X2 n=1 Tax=Andrographis paniculata TaxID=175694 RepID=UPI0021E7075F|nr:cytosolic sulfotransferase 5-like isoform X2 [Andrographis paniculata]
MKLLLSTLLYSAYPYTYVSIYRHTCITLAKLVMSNSIEKACLGAEELPKACLDAEELPKACLWETMHVIRWGGFWFPAEVVKPAMTFRSSFTARNDDVSLASSMKTGTTWLKSLALSCILSPDDGADDLLAADSPHILVPSVEAVVFNRKRLKFDIYDASAPRLIHTHIPYSLLPDSIKSSSSSTKIVYIARNPKDTLISWWHFLKSNSRSIPLEKAFDAFSSGVCNYGSFFDHVAEYWIESRKRPEKILFLKNEELKSNPKAQISKMAEFLGKPIGSEDEVEKIIWRCSLERMKNLEVNKSGRTFVPVSNDSFFRKGEVGDWKNYLTPEMAERIDQLSRDRHEAID